MNQAAFYLGIDGGQSHTEAVIAEANGNILGRGLGGASNHAEQPGGRERLQKAIMESVGQALYKARLPLMSEIRFASAYCAMTGSADYKAEIIGDILQTDKLVAAHDAPAALFGATAGKPGVVVIAGTGSVVYAENEKGENLTVGGWGYLFGDQGSGFWLTMELARLEIDYFNRTGKLTSKGGQLIKFFSCQDLRELVKRVYSEQISRDDFASFAQQIHEWADAGDQIIADVFINGCGKELATLVSIAVKRIEFENGLLVTPVGGNFRGATLQKSFSSWLHKTLPQASVIKPRFSPAVGALLLAYREAGLSITDNHLINLEKSILE